MTLGFTVAFVVFAVVALFAVAGYLADKSAPNNDSDVDKEARL